MLFSVIVNIILFIVYFVISLFIPKRYNYIWRQYVARCMMYIVGFRSITTTNLDNLYDLFHSDESVIVVLNHRSLYDPWVSLASLGCVCSVFQEEGMRGFYGLQTAVQSFSNSILIKKGNTVSKIKEYVDNRKSGDELLCVFADGMRKIPKGSVIAPFKTGAFVPRCKVVPVVIKYKNYTIDPEYRWEDGDDMIWAQFRMFLDNSCDIVVDVLDVVEPDNMTIEEHRDKVHRLMERRYKEL
jgi:1-acyl-sn-glycerol-3-phosphate acyltransferase